MHTTHRGPTRFDSASIVLWRQMMASNVYVHVCMTLQLFCQRQILFIICAFLRSACECRVCYGYGYESRIIYIAFEWEILQRVIGPLSTFYHRSLVVCVATI